MHGYVFGVSMTRSQRCAIVDLLPTQNQCLPQDDSCFRDIDNEIDATLRELQPLCDDGSDEEWQTRMQAAMRGDSTLCDKLTAVTAFFDVGPSISGNLRVPCSTNRKENKMFYGFPLLCPLTTSEPWPHVTSQTPELTPSQTRTLLALDDDAVCDASKWDAFCAEVRRTARLRPARRQNSRLPCAIPRLLHVKREIRCDPHLLLPSSVRGFIADDVLQELRRGCERGGSEPYLWRPEPADKIAEMFPGNVTPGVCGALLLLSGSKLKNVSYRGRIVASLMISRFPVDAWANAFKLAQKSKGCGGFGRWFESYANQRSKPSMCWSYETGNWQQMRLQPGNIRQHAHDAARILDPDLRKASSSSTERTHATSRKRAASAVTDDELTGRVVKLKLTRTSEEIMRQVTPKLRERTHEESGTQFEQVRKKASDNVDKICANVDRDGILTFEEYVASEGRLGYRVGDFKGIKSILREVRDVVFAGLFRIDLKRCHTTMLLGPLRAAHEDGKAAKMSGAQVALLTAIFEDLASVEAAIDRERSALFQTDTGKSRFLQPYKEFTGKLMFSVVLNHEKYSPVFSSWPTLKELLALFVMAYPFACKHPFVVADASFAAKGYAKNGESREARQAIACLMERRAVQIMIDELQKMGFEPSITINDEVLFSAPLSCDKVVVRKQTMARLKHQFGFDIDVKVEEPAVWL